MDTYLDIVYLGHCAQWRCPEPPLKWTVELKATVSGDGDWPIYHLLRSAFFRNVDTNAMRSYLKPYFHRLDATIIIAGFLIEVVLKGVLEEIASLILVLRLWRFVKIFEEFSVGANEQCKCLPLSGDDMVCVENEYADLRG